MPGPGSGVALSSGRIVAVGVSGSAYSSDAVFWSDDAGLSWATSEKAVLGPGMDEAATILGRPLRSTERIWTYARAWLARELRDFE